MSTLGFSSICSLRMSQYVVGICIINVTKIICYHPNRNKSKKKKKVDKNLFSIVPSNTGVELVIRVHRIT